MKKKISVVLSLLLSLTAVFATPTLSSCKEGVEISFATATTEEIKPITRKTGARYGKLPTPKREGYTFLGWKTEKIDGEYARRSVKVEKDIDHTLYAKWRKDEEEITFPLEVKKERLEQEVTLISTSYYIDKNGQLYAWGDNEDGQLGDGTRETRLSPLAVMKDKKFAQVDSDGFARVYGIDEDGGLWSWGSRRKKASPPEGHADVCLIPERILPNKKFCQIETGWGFNRHFALALDINGGLWAWGDNYYGQLGQGGKGNAQTNPWEDSGDDTPVRIKEDVRFVDISTNGETCGAIDEEGKLWLWGDNLNGELANGTSYVLTDKMKDLQSSTPTVATETEGLYFTQVYCTETNTFAIDDEGNIWGSGSGFWGRLGNGTEKDSCVLIQLTFGLRFQQIKVGEIIRIALDDYGDLWWWGVDKMELIHNAECLKDDNNSEHIHLPEFCEGVIEYFPTEADIIGLNMLSFSIGAYSITFVDVYNRVFAWHCGAGSESYSKSREKTILGDGTKDFHSMYDYVQIL